MVLLLLLVCRLRLLAERQRYDTERLRMLTRWCCYTNIDLLLLLNANLLRGNALLLLLLEMSDIGLLHVEMACRRPLSRNGLEILERLELGRILMELARLYGLVVTVLKRTYGHRAMIQVFKHCPLRVGVDRREMHRRDALAETLRLLLLLFLSQLIVLSPEFLVTDIRVYHVCCRECTEFFVSCSSRLCNVFVDFKIKIQVAL